MEHYGFTVIPPDPYGNQQRVFVPRAALQSVEVLGVVGSPLKTQGQAVPARTRSACSRNRRPGRNPRRHSRTTGALDTVYCI